MQETITTPQQRALAEPAGQSLLHVISDALAQLADESAVHDVLLAWTIDPDLPAYVRVNRIDLFAIISVLVRRALPLAPAAALHLTIARLPPESGAARVALQLEDDGDVQQALPVKEWLQLQFWVEELGGSIARAAVGLQWRVVLPLDPLSAVTAAVSRTRVSSGGGWQRRRFRFV